MKREEAYPVEEYLSSWTDLPKLLNPKNGNPLGLD